MLTSKNKGFLLLEVMLAVAILSLGLVLVLRSYLGSLRATKVAHNLLVANLLLEEKIWQKEQEKASPEGLTLMQEQDSFDSPFANFSYKISFSQEPDLPILYKSSYEVFWQQRQREWSSSCLNYTCVIEE